MSRNEIIYYAGIAIVVIVSEVGGRYGVGCLAFPILLLLMYLTFNVFPIKQDD
jgi:hypothetical protein